MEQYPINLHIHEVFELSQEKFFNNRNNPLRITPKTFKFERSPMTFGIFDINKIKKEPDDFHLTIKFKKQDLIKEYFAGLRYYGSLQFYKKISSDYEKCLFNLVSNFNDLTDEDFFELLESGKAYPLRYKNFSYKLRKEQVNQEENFDYVGEFDDWPTTIKEIKDKIGLDLTSLKKERTKSYNKSHG